MKKQPIDIHPVDQFMQALDAKSLPDLNEFHWEGMQAMLDENFPQEEEPSAGAAQSDSKPETGAGKVVKRFKWIFLGGMALIVTMAGTQWNALALQRSEIRQEQNMSDIDKVPEERSTSSIDNFGGKRNEIKSESIRFENAGSGNMSQQMPVSEATHSELTQSDLDDVQGIQSQLDEKINQGTGIALDSIPGKKHAVPDSDTTRIKKKFIFW